MLRHLFAFLAVLALIACEEKPQAAAPAGTNTPSNTAPLRIAVVPKGTTHDFWKSIHAGAIKAARELSADRPIEITFRGPEKEDDRDQQVSLVQNLIAGRYDAICLAPLDDTALVAPVRQATAAGIPVVIIDSGLNAEVGKDFIAFVATDNLKGGRLAGERLAQLLNSQGRVLLLRYQEGSASTTQREQGFLDALAAHPGIQVIDPPRYAGPTRATAQEAAENLLSASGEIHGVFCPNESSTFGMLLALRARGLAGKVRFIGFDASDAVVEALRNGELDALILQNPMRMGELGVRTAVDHLAGKPIETHIDTGVGLIDRSNMDTPESKALLTPDLAPYLGGS